jgi:predicted RNA-binding protein YlxR (DUF448 family)
MIRSCVACKKPNSSSGLIRFAAEGKQLLLLCSPPISGRSGWVCRSISCIKKLIQSPKCSYRSLRRAVTNTEPFIRQLNAQLCAQLITSLRQLQRSGRIVFGRRRIAAKSEEAELIIVSTKGQFDFWEPLFTKTRVLLFKETPKLIAVALHKRVNSVMSIMPNREATQFKETLLLWSELYSGTPPIFTQSKFNNFSVIWDEQKAQQI